MLKDSKKYDEGLLKTIDRLSSFHKYNVFEKYIEMPFRHKIWNPFKDFYWNLKHLPANIKRWWPIIWSYRNWDSHFTLDALKVALQGQKECFEWVEKRGWGSVDNKEYLKDVTVCVELLKRILADDYQNKRFYFLYDTNPKKAYEYMRKMEKQDLDYLLKKLKKIKHWWD